MGENRMTVRELIEALSCLDPDLPVIAQGTEWDDPVVSAEERWWQETEKVCFLSLGF